MPLRLRLPDCSIDRTKQRWTKCLARSECSSAGSSPISVLVSVRERDRTSQRQQGVCLALIASILRFCGHDEPQRKVSASAKFVKLSTDSGLRDQSAADQRNSDLVLSCSQFT